MVSVPSDVALPTIASVECTPKTIACNDNKMTKVVCTGKGKSLTGKATYKACE